MSLSVDPRIGSELFGYRLEALLGRGGMGVVYKAYDPRLKRYVALKLIAPELSDDDRFRERFLAESELAASLDHPNVVPIYDAFDAEGRLAIAMRYVEGTDLKQLLHTERVLDPARALGICGQVAAALDAAHARGLVHRDVKPSNVLLDENEHVYLADFGLSRRLADLGGRGEGRAVRRDARLCLAGADRTRFGGRPSRRVRARLRPLRVPDRRGAVPTRLRARRALGTRPGAAADGKRAEPRPADRDRHRHRQGDGEIPGRPVRKLRRVRRGRTRCARCARASQGQIALAGGGGRSADRRRRLGRHPPQPGRRSPGGRARRRR